MSKTELQEWTKWFKTPEKLEEYLRNQIVDDPDNLLNDVLPTLAHLLYYSFDAEFFQICYGEYYCWKHVPNCSVDDVQCREVIFQRGDRLVLQLKTLAGQWTEYLYMATSQYNGGVGIYTARKIPKGACLGMYLGPCVWSAERVGTEVTSTDFLQLPNQMSHRRSSPSCLCLVRDKTGRMIILNPERVVPDINPQPLYLGMHYVKDIEEKGVPKRLANCEIIADGGVLASTALEADQELICGILETDEDSND
jgi:hypothetical protein